MRTTGLALVLVSLFVAHVGAQPVGKPARIGLLSPAPSGVLFRQALRELGYVDGQNLVLEQRSADGELSRLPQLAADLVRLKVDVLVAVANESIRAAKDTTTTIPIVMAFSSDDPVTSGFVSSYARPGGNVTGLTLLSPSLATKRLELLKEAVPGLNRVAVLVNPRRVSYQLRHAEAAARSLGLRLQVVNVQTPADYPTAFAAMTREKAQALLVTPDPAFYTYRAQLIELAARHRLPALYEARAIAESGGLMVYGPSYDDLWRRAAQYVDRVLKGARPADLPVEDPIKFELVVNLRTARALGLTIPRSVLLRADQVVE